MFPSIFSTSLERARYASNDQGDTNIELSQVSLIQGQENVITARLKDQLGRVLVGAQISFHLNDLDLGTTTTDSRGYANVVCGPRDPGTYSLTSEFPGNGRFRGSISVWKKQGYKFLHSN